MVVLTGDLPIREEVMAMFNRKAIAFRNLNDRKPFLTVKKSQVLKESADYAEMNRSGS